MQPVTCPVARSLDVVGDRWSLLIVRDVFDGVRRFSGFVASSGVARNILADRLRKLVEHGILELVPASDGSSFQEYTLTSQGEALFPVIVALRQWGEATQFARGEPHSLLIERATGRPVPKQAIRGREGKPMKPADTYVRKLVD